MESLFQSMNTLSVRKCFLMSSLNLPMAALNWSHMVYHWIPRRRAQHFPPHSPTQKSVRQQWGCPQPAFLQTRPTQSPPLLLIGRSSPSTAFVALLWMYSSDSEVTVNNNKDAFLAWYLWTDTACHRFSRKSCWWFYRIKHCKHILASDRGAQICN